MKSLKLTQILFGFSLLLSAPPLHASTQYFSASATGMGSRTRYFAAGPTEDFEGCFYAAEAAVEAAFGQCTAIYGDANCGGSSDRCGSTQNSAWSKGCVSYSEQIRIGSQGVKECVVKVVVAGSSDESEKRTWVSYVPTLSQIGEFIAVLGKDHTPHESNADSTLRSNFGHLNNLTNPNFAVNLGKRHIGHYYGGYFEMYAEITPLRAPQNGRLRGGHVCTKGPNTCAKLIRTYTLSGENFSLTASCRPAKKEDGCPRSGFLGMSSGYALETTLNIAD